MYIQRCHDNAYCLDGAHDIPASEPQSLSGMSSQDKHQAAISAGVRSGRPHSGTRSSFQGAHAGLNVPRNSTGAIIGGVLGGIALLTLLSLACWSYLTYAFRAQKHLFEDQVYSLVIGARSDDIYELQLHDSSSEVRMPHPPRPHFPSPKSRSMSHKLNKSSCPQPAMFHKLDTMTSMICIVLHLAPHSQQCGRRVRSSAPEPLIQSQCIMSISIIKPSHGAQALVKHQMMTNLVLKGPHEHIIATS